MIVRRVRNVQDVRGKLAQKFAQLKFKLGHVGHRR
jgi:hypothetical protein